MTTAAGKGWAAHARAWIAHAPAWIAHARWLPASLAVLCCVAWGQGGGPTASAQAEMKAAIEAARKAQVIGPSELKLADQATLKLPKGFVYIPPSEGQKLMAAMGNRVGDGLLGLIFPESGSGWFVAMRFYKSGYIKDDDAKEWKVDELLKGLKEGTEESNKDRRERGFPEFEVTGWIEAPQYDATTHRLVWSLASKEKNAPAGEEGGVNYNTYALGREGYISMNLVTGVSAIEAEKPVAHQLLTALEYNDGKRYTQFDSSTDHIAEFGLAALIGGIAAKKLGLFALFAAFAVKFAKVILLAGIGLIGVIGKLMGRKKDAGSAPPPQA
jgi:uncharacterized membrane-anchored protein